MGVSKAVGSGNIGLGGSEGDISNGVGQRGGTKRGRGIGTGRDDEPVMRRGNTK